MRTFSLSIPSSMRMPSMIDSHSATRSTPMTTSSKRWPSSPPSAARQTSRGSRSRRPVSASWLPSSHTGRKRREREHRVMVTSGLRASTGYRKSAVRAALTLGATIHKPAGRKKLGPRSLASSITAVVPSNSLTTTTTANSQTSSLQAPTTASCTCWRIRTCFMKTASWPWLPVYGST